MPLENEQSESQVPDDSGAVQPQQDGGGDGGSPPPGEQQFEGYPTDFETLDRGKVIHETVIDGRRVGLTAADMDQIVHHAIQQERRRGLNQDGEPRREVPKEAPKEEAPKPDPRYDSLEQQVKELTQKLNAREHADAVKTRASELQASLETEFGTHKVFQDYPDMREVALQQAMAYMSANTSMSAKEAMQRVASAQGKVINAATEKYVKSKINDAANSEAQPGGDKVATPGPKKLTGKDLMRGRVADAVRRRLAAKDVS